MLLRKEEVYHTPKQSRVEGNYRKTVLAYNPSNKKVVQHNTRTHRFGAGQLSLVAFRAIQIFKVSIGASIG